MIPVKVGNVFVYNEDFVVLLRGTEDRRALPIFVERSQAHSIAVQLEKLQFPRPLTHDLFKNVMDVANVDLKRVEVCDLREGTFYARLIIEKNGVEAEIDARPSDAIALGLRYDAPVFVAEKVMDEAGVIITGDSEAPERQPKLTPLESLKEKLQRAIDEERYEDAASLRDKIKRLETSQSSN